MTFLLKMLALSKCLEDCIENLQTDLDIFRPDFARADLVVAKVWAAGVSEKMHKTEKSKMNDLFATLPLRDCKRAEARVLSSSGIGAQWLATAPTSYLNQLSDEDMRTDIRILRQRNILRHRVSPRQRRWSRMRC